LQLGWFGAGTGCASFSGVERGKSLNPILSPLKLSLRLIFCFGLTLLVSCGPSGFHEPMSSISSEPVATYVPTEMYATPYKIQTKNENGTVTPTDVQLIDGATREGKMELVTDAATSTVTLKGRMNLQPREGGAPIEFAVDFKGRIETSKVTGLGASHMRPLNSAALAALKLETTAKMMCLGEDCSEYFVNIYVRHNGNKTIYYRHQVIPKQKKTESSVKTEPKPEAKPKKELPRRSCPDFSCADEDGNYYESEVADDDSQGGYFIGEPTKDLEKFDDVSKATSDDDLKPLLPEDKKSKKDANEDSERDSKAKANDSKTDPKVEAKADSQTDAKESSVTGPKGSAEAKPQENSAGNPKEELDKNKDPKSNDTKQKSESQNSGTSGNPPKQGSASPPTAPANPPAAPAPAPQNPPATPLPVTMVEPPKEVPEILGQANGTVHSGKLLNPVDIFTFLKDKKNAGYRIINSNRMTHFATRDIHYMLSLAGEYSIKNVNNYVLSVGDLSKPNGGNFGHKSHASGMDMDVSYYFNREALKQSGFVNVLGDKVNQEAWMIEAQWGLFKTLVVTQRPDLIFVHKKLKKALCEHAKKVGDYRSGQKSGAGYEVLRRLWEDEDHADHFHLRIFCNGTQPLCQPPKPNYKLPVTTGCN
jgi:hypothetical protein